MDTLSIQATPYAPGQARGVLTRATAEPASNTILTVSQHELKPFAMSCPAGVVVVDGAPLSHAMIRLLALGIPVVVATAEEARQLPEGQEVVLDGERGRIQSIPDDTQSRYRPPPPPPVGDVTLTTADGTRIELRASVADERSAANARRMGASAIGLLRSEFLTPEDGTAPDAYFYQQAIAGVCTAAKPLAVTIRLLDIASDKTPSWLNVTRGCGTLGLQGSRLYGIEPVRSVFYAELQAIAELLPEYDINLLLPYVVSLDEFVHWRDEIRARLPESIAIGTMAETPAAALEMEHWFEVADFVAIGCNDLMQCLFAADRDLAELRPYLDAYAPLLHRFMRQLASAAGPHLDNVQICGLLPQLPGVLPVLLGLGYRIFSIEPLLMPYLANTVRQTDLQQAEQLATQVCSQHSASEVRQLLGLSGKAAWSQAF